MHRSIAKFVSNVLVAVSKSVANTSSPVAHSPQIPQELKK